MWYQIKYILELLIVQTTFNQRLLSQWVWKYFIEYHCIELLKCFVDIFDVDARLDDASVVY